MSKLLGTEESSRKSYPDSVLNKLLIPGGSVLVAIISVLSMKELPVWALAVLVGFVGLIAIVIMAPVANWALSKVRISHQLRRAANRLYPQLERMVQRLQDQVAQNVSDTLVCELKQLMSVKDNKGNMLLPDLSMSINLSEWLHLIRVRVARGRAQDLFDVAQSIGLATNQYNQFCRMIESRLSAVVADKMLDDSALGNLKRIWNHGREGQVRVIHEWAAIAHEINREFGAHVCIEYLSPLKTLE